VSITDYLLGDVTSKFTQSAVVESEQADTPITFAKLKERTDWMAIQYYIRGWEQGEMLAVLMPNQALFTITCLGAAKVGIPFTVIDPASTPFEIIHQLKDSRTLYIVTTKALLPLIRQVTAAMRGLKEILILDKDDDPEEKKQIRFSIEMKYNLLLGKPPGWGALPDWTVKPEDTATIYYGPAIKGGKPKGIVVSHKNLITSVMQAEQVLKDLTQDDVLLSVAPYFLLDAYTIINNLAILKGIKSVTVINPTLQNVIEAVQKNNVTILRATSAFLAELATSPKVELASLKRIIVDAAPIDKAVLDGVKKNYPNVAIDVSYFSPTLISYNQKLVAATEAKADDEGSLWVKGDQVPMAIHNNEELTAQRVDKDGFFNTLDKAKFDGDKLFVTLKPLTDE